MNYNRPQYRDGGRVRLNRGNKSNVFSNYFMPDFLQDTFFQLYLKAETGLLAYMEKITLQIYLTEIV